MQQHDIEQAIAERFDALADRFPEELDPEDFRMRVVADFFGEIKGAKVLDVGCAKGRFAKALAKLDAKVVGVDSSEKLIESARVNVPIAEFFVGSATHLDFQNNAFDRVLCVETLEHIPDIEKAIAEMMRVVKSGGKVLIIDKNKFSFHPTIFIPRLALKTLMEYCNQWFYPRNFPFHEQWFSNHTIEQMLEKYASRVESSYLKDTENKLFSFLPFLNFFIAWKAIK
ncbi:MAG: class I SAM-dependent methyltransferase [Candidatus Wildermuthbacteria bacterium]|nr:class I SAM-dependent methyltransferase [Candidatus Wildermuthbacteria bacterium]